MIFPFLQSIFKFSHFLMIYLRAVAATLAEGGEGRDQYFIQTGTAIFLIFCEAVNSKSPHTITSGLLSHGETKTPFQSYFQR